MPIATESLDVLLTRLLDSEHDAMQDPIPLYHRVREESPVHQLGDVYLVSRIDDVRAVITDTRTYSSAMQGAGNLRTERIRSSLSPEHQQMFDDVHGRERLFITQSDGPDHRRRRAIASHLFTPRRIAELEALTQDFANAVFDSQLDAHVADMEWCAWRLPALVMATLLGARIEDTDQLVQWADMVEGYVNMGGHGNDPLERSHQAHQEFGEYAIGMLGEHRSGKRRTALMEALMGAESDDLLSESQLKAQMLEMLLGGFETTRVLLSAGLFLLLTYRPQWETLVADPTPTAARRVTEELIRLVSPVQWTGRIPRTDVEIGGVRIPAGATVQPMLGAANRDPRAFEAPDEMRVDRPSPRQHVAFGQGPHYCLGQALARLEGRLWFATLARRFPEMELVTTTLTYHGNAIVRRPSSLDVRFGPDSGAR